ncbi:hypothetical protein J1N35_023316 [Gossypium stocksii]|uniref:Uncharacterized protein n=1 Tax=Gossypium stocksii TaxID=47602 RepID=A0A9D3VHP3_9ROSI|nr:hypothetical protein J1N35_023316 [Gossypium stocksii]
MDISLTKKKNIFIFYIRYEIAQNTYELRIEKARFNYKSVLESIFDGFLFTAMHGSLVTSSLIRETTENEYANEGYRFGQEEETYNIVATHGYFGRLIFD